MSDVRQDRQILDLILPKLEGDGYSVYVHPPRQILPTFMGDYVPDAIALGQPKNLAIEIVRDGPDGASKEARIAERFTGVPDWELRVFYIRPGRDAVAINGVPRDIVEAAIEKVETLASYGQNEAAILFGWSAFEAIGRLFAPERLTQAQPAGRLIELLAADGIVTPDEASLLRHVGALRNQIAHGALEARVEPADLHAFLAILKIVMRENTAVPVTH
jgi:hypothetical protein